jgi:hypothetical protein
LGSAISASSTNTAINSSKKVSVCAPVAFGGDDGASRDHHHHHHHHHLSSPHPTSLRGSARTSTRFHSSAFTTYWRAVSPTSNARFRTPPTAARTRPS